MSATLGGDVITAALTTCKVITEGVQKIRNAESERRHIEKVINFVAGNLRKTNNLLHSDRSTVPSVYLDDFFKIAKALEKDLGLLQSKIPKPRSRLFGPVTALELHLSGIEFVLKHVDRPAIGAPSPLQNTGRRYDNHENLRKMYQDIADDNVSEYDRFVGEDTPSIEEIEDRKLAELNINRALILKRIDFETTLNDPEPPVTLNGFDRNSRHDDAQTVIGHPGPDEVELRCHYSQTMAEKATQLQFYEFAADFYLQAITMRDDLNQGDHDFRQLVLLETRYINVLLSCRETGTHLPAADRVQTLAARVTQYTSNTATADRDPDVLYEARRDVGALLLKFGQPDQAIQLLRLALFEGILKSGKDNEDDIKYLVSLISRAYYETADFVKRNAFQKTVKSRLGWDPSYEPVEEQQTATWLRNHGFVIPEHDFISTLELYCDEMGNNPLHKAARDSLIEPDTLHSLITKCTNINALNSAGLTPLMVAVEWSNEMAVRELFDKGASINIHDDRHQTLLHVCKSPKIMHFLITEIHQRRASVAEHAHAPHTLDVNAKDVHGKVALHHACRRGNADLVRELLRGNPDINAKSVGNMSPFETVCESHRRGSLEILRLLVDHESRLPSASTGETRKAREYAMRKGGYSRQDINELLRGRRSGGSSGSVSSNYS